MPVPKVSACTVEGAFDEGVVVATLIAYRKGHLEDYFKKCGSTGEYRDVRRYLIVVFNMVAEDAEFWLDRHDVK